MQWTGSVLSWALGRHGHLGASPLRPYPLSPIPTRGTARDAQPSIYGSAVISSSPDQVAVFCG